MLPQVQRRSSSPAARTWPRSPAEPWAPRWSRPPVMMPAPMPVATLTKSRCSTSGQPSSCSPSAMRLTSLSTSTGRVDVVVRCSAGMSKPSQPGMIGGLHRPAGGELDRPGQADADAGEVLGRAAGRGRAWSTRSSTDPVEHRLGPVGDVDRPRSTRRSRRPRRSVTATRGVGGAEVGGEHDPGMRVEGEPGRRPAAGGARPRRPARRSPAASSSSTRAATVERASPVSSASSARVRAVAVAQELEQLAGRERSRTQTPSFRTVNHRLLRRRPDNL